MKTIKIPYLYNYNRNEKYLMLNDVNVGITLCRRLGWSPCKVILSKKDYKKIPNFHPPIEQFLNNWGLEIESNGKLNQLIFVCNRKYVLRVSKEILDIIRK